MPSPRCIALIIVLVAICSLLPQVTLAAENNIITFQSLDSADRTVMFTSSVGKEELPTISVPAGQSVDVVLPHGWIGNYLAVVDGEHHVPGSGVIGEVAFNAFEDKTYFDVSAIDDPGDEHGIRMLWPAGEDGNTSGCWVEFPCGNAYTESGDKQTRVTAEKHLIAMLGRPPAREEEDDVAGGDRDGFGREGLGDS
ncbi:hypothetical protein MCOR27_004183 [Pyricularia oryzae]|uniref:DNase1 protein n=1 Tax=Pyricularia grisea TaxID=148305 RepID=A0ABQ8NGF0_PYRGI|nr:hypothetical protein MCOR01_001994 [Pyricularia oryzae]KAI6296706.1 hypothetical protein MCOR33_006753 [Pyricularia grisea]KAI6272900.1 hypothetical protein MCOR26_007131 [Pyricularia oryzae]KAI6281488.1 hypothetical protein MCOR27_004183 [Pyricularia oryzae]KAI6322379.1 hypothetical protein MCOR29_004779 [Pyricularia oryzae]